MVKQEEGSKFPLLPTLTYKSPFQDQKVFIKTFCCCRIQGCFPPFFLMFVHTNTGTSHIFASYFYLPPLHLQPLSLYSDGVSEKQATSASKTFSSSFYILLWIGGTELQIDLVDLTLSIKLLLWSRRSRVYLPWLGQWSFRKWSHLKDAKWQLHLSPRAQCTPF